MIKLAHLAIGVVLNLTFHLAPDGECVIVIVPEIKVGIYLLIHMILISTAKFTRLQSIIEFSYNFYNL